VPIQLDAERGVLELFREDLIKRVDLAEERPELVLACIASALSGPRTDNTARDVRSGVRSSGVVAEVCACLCMQQRRFDHEAQALLVRVMQRSDGSDSHLGELADLHDVNIVTGCAWILTHYE